MSRDQGTEDQGKKVAPAAKEETKAESTELTDDDLKQVSGGAALTFGREKLKGTTKTQGDFNLVGGLGSGDESLRRRPGR